MPHRGFGCPTLLPGRSGIQLPGGFLKRCSFRNTLVKSLPNSVKVKHLGAAQKEMTTSPSPQQPGVTTTGTVAELPWGLGTTWKISKPYGSSFEETGLVRRCKATSEEIREPQLGTMSYLKRHPYSGQQGSLIQGISFKPSKGIICVTSLDGHSPGKYICVLVTGCQSSCSFKLWSPRRIFICHRPFSSLALLANRKLCPGRPSSLTAMTKQHRNTWWQLIRHWCCHPNSPAIAVRWFLQQNLS